jgi:hypothetical protein
MGNSRGLRPFTQPPQHRLAGRAGGTTLHPPGSACQAMMMSLLLPPRTCSFCCLQRCAPQPHPAPPAPGCCACARRIMWGREAAARAARLTGRRGAVPELKPVAAAMASKERSCTSSAYSPPSPACPICRGGGNGGGNGSSQKRRVARGCASGLAVSEGQCSACCPPAARRVTRLFKEDAVQQLADGLAAAQVKRHAGVATSGWGGLAGRLRQAVATTGAASRPPRPCCCCCCWAWQEARQGAEEEASKDSKGSRAGHVVQKLVQSAPNLRHQPRG